MKKNLLPKKPIRLRSLNFGPAIYRINYVDKLLTEDDTRRLAGNINHAHCTLNIDPDADPQSMIETILHEGIHYYLVQFGQEDAINPARAEDVVETIANGIMTILRLNPDFVKAVQEL